MNSLGPFLLRNSGKGKKQPCLHYTAAQLVEKGVLVEIEDLPSNQYVSLEGRGSPFLSHYLRVEHSPALKRLLEWGEQKVLGSGHVWHSSRHPEAEEEDVRSAD